MVSPMATDEDFSAAVAAVLTGEKAISKLSFTELGERAGMDRVTAHRLLSGKRPIDLRQLTRLCEALGVSRADVIAAAEARIHRGE